MFEVKAVLRTPILGVVAILLIIRAACGGSSKTIVYSELVSARVIVTDVQASADNKRVEYITVLMDDGEEITMILGEGIEPAAWDPNHLLAHAGLGESLGLKIGVTYARSGDSVMATQLSE